MKVLEEFMQKIKDTIGKKKSADIEKEEVSEGFDNETGTKESDIKEKILANLGIKPLNIKKLAIVGGGLSAMLIVGVMFSTSGTDETSNAPFLNNTNNPNLHSFSKNSNNKKVSLNVENTSKNINYNKKPMNINVKSQVLKDNKVSNTKKPSNNLFQNSGSKSAKPSAFDKKINIENPINACRPNLSNIDKLFLSFVTERKRLLQEEKEKKESKLVATNKGRDFVKYKRVSEEEVLKLLEGKGLKKKEKKQKENTKPVPVNFINLEITGIFCPTVKECYAITNIGVVKKGMVLPYGEKVVQISAERGIVTDKRVIPY